MGETREDLYDRFNAVCDRLNDLGYEALSYGLGEAEQGTFEEDQKLVNQLERFADFLADHPTEPKP